MGGYRFQARELHEAVNAAGGPREPGALVPVVRLRARGHGILVEVGAQPHPHGTGLIIQATVSDEGRGHRRRGRDLHREGVGAEGGGQRFIEPSGRAG